MEPQAHFIITSSHDHAGILMIHKAQPSPNVLGHVRLLNGANALLPISIVVILLVATRFSPNATTLPQALHEAIEA